MATPVERPFLPRSIFLRKPTGFNSFLDGAVRRVRIEESSLRSELAHVGVTATRTGPQVPTGGILSCRSATPNDVRQPAGGNLWRGNRFRPACGWRLSACCP